MFDVKEFTISSRPTNFSRSRKYLPDVQNLELLVGERESSSSSWIQRGVKQTQCILLYRHASKVICPGKTPTFYSLLVSPEYDGVNPGHTKAVH